MQTLTTSPWGTPDHQEFIAEGIAFVSTPSHGGFFLDTDRNALVPAAWRAASFGGQARLGYYEEDCDACMVVLTFPEAFPDAKAREYARKTFDAWIAPKLA